MMWENYKSIEHAYDFATLNNGTGYLYANAIDFTLSFTGELKPYNEANGDNEVAVPEGWSLIGNPFVCNVYTGRPFYKLNAEGSAIVAVENYATTAIAPCTSIMIFADEAGTVTFTKDIQQQKANQGGIQIALAQANTRSNAMIDNAIVNAKAQDELPLNFKAKKNGTYTLTVSQSLNSKSLNINYLHLIDNMTGEDIDMLQTPNYTFEAKVSDYESRFKLVFNVDEDNQNSNDNFAFFHNGELIVNGEGMLQIFDVLGHEILCRHLSPFTSHLSPFTSPGVYVLRLIDGQNVRTQRIVID